MVCVASEASRSNGCWRGGCGSDHVEPGNLCEGCEFHRRFEWECDMVRFSCKKMAGPDNVQDGLELEFSNQTL